MDVQAVRAVAMSVAFATHGVSAIVTVPDGAAVTTRAIWMLTPDEAMPVGRDFQRRDPRRLMALPTGATLPEVPRGTIVVAARPGAPVAESWQVENVDRKEADHIRVIVKPVEG